LNLTSGFREVFAKQKFGKIQQEFSSKSLLNEGERSERLQAVPEDLLKANRRVIFSGVLSNERMRYIKNKNRGGQSLFLLFLGEGLFCFFFSKKENRGGFYFCNALFETKTKTFIYQHISTY